jgi:hypothetical protein
MGNHGGGQPADDVAARRARAPWHQTKHALAVADILAWLRRAPIASQYVLAHPAEPTTAEMLKQRGGGGLVVREVDDSNDVVLAECPKNLTKNLTNLAAVLLDEAPEVLGPRMVSRKFLMPWSVQLIRET